MRAIDRKDLEFLTINITHPAGNICGLPIRWIHEWVSIGCEARLDSRKPTQRAKREPGFIPRPPPANHGRKNIAHDGNRKDHADGSIEEKSELHQHPTSRKSIPRSH